MRRDDTGRGPAQFQEHGRFLAEGQLASAAESLAGRAQAVAIVTGFAIPVDGVFRAETDGPPGALFLARLLHHWGCAVQLLGDAPVLPLLKVGCHEVGLPESCCQEFPLEPYPPDHPLRAQNDSPPHSATEQWIERWLASDFGRKLTHLISIERVGPSHTVESLTDQVRDSPAPLAEFERLVPPDHRNQCHTMRGQIVTSATAKLHRLFEVVARQRPEVKTIGIGDGGNELGLGQLPWELLCRAIRHGPAAQVACRIATRHLLVAGVSNFGGYALGLLMSRYRGQLASALTWRPADEGRLIERLVADAGAVDGFLRLPQATVDSLPLDAYLAHYDTMQSAVQ